MIDAEPGNRKALFNAVSQRPPSYVNDRKLGERKTVHQRYQLERTAEGQFRPQQTITRIPASTLKRASRGQSVRADLIVRNDLGGKRKDGVPTFHPVDGNGNKNAVKTFHRHPSTVEPLHRFIADPQFQQQMLHDDRVGAWTSDFVESGADHAARIDFPKRHGPVDVTDCIGLDALYRAGVPDVHGAANVALLQERAQTGLKAPLLELAFRTQTKRPPVTGHKWVGEEGGTADQARQYADANADQLTVMTTQRNGHS